MRSVVVLLCVVSAAMLAGCGGDDQAPTGDGAPLAPGSAGAALDDGSRARSNPFIGSLSVDPRDGTLMIGTGLGLYRLRDGDQQPARVVGRLTTPRGVGAVSAGLELVHLSRGAGCMRACPTASSSRRRTAA